MKFVIFLILTVLCSASYGQAPGRFKLQGDFSKEDSVHILRSYTQAHQAADRLYDAMISVWDVSDMSADNGLRKMDVRAERWRKDETFMMWLGEPDHMRLVARNIRRIHRKFDRKKFTLEVVKEDEGRCNRWVGAWAAPYGRVKIRLCRNFLNMRSDQAAKVLVHEVGHETGMLFHQDLFSCRDVLKAATEQSDEAKRSPETYAWLAMSYMGLDCNSRWR
jgi:hypothetical protein